MKRLTTAAPIIVVGLVQFAVAQDLDRLQFNRDVRPILAEHCFACHGFDSKKREADLRLDVADDALKNRDGKFAIKPRDLDRSAVWQRVNSTDPDVVMPPPETGKKLSKDEIDVIRRWIEQGAAYQKHWAFEPPIRHSVPQVDNDDWVRNPLDRFILSRLEREGLAPQPEADRRTLIRRVSFALTGLPPTVAEVDSFVNDRSDKAWDRLVDHFLSSPRFGEEQARHWLDVARYADTHGLHLDNERQMWAYRDWVVKAFNQNLSFDQFTTWQLAGDLLPNPTLDQRIATGFNRCNVTTSEGGSIKPEWLYRYAVDRTSATAEAWMGLTAGCAVCHDHKFDPLSTKEFYSLYAFFYSAADPAMDGNVENTNPFTKVPNTRQSAELKAARAAEADALQQLEAALEKAPYDDPAAVEQRAEATEEEPGEETAVMKPVNDSLVDDDFQYGTRVVNTSRNAVKWLFAPDFGAKAGQRVIEMAYGAQFDITIDLALIPTIVPVDGRIEFWVRVDPYYPPRALAIQFDDGKVNRRAVWGDEGQLKGGFHHMDLGPVPKPGEWVQLTIPLEDLGLPTGARVKKLVLTQNGGRVWVDDVRLVGRTNPSEDPLTSFSSWWQRSKDGNPGGITDKLRSVLVGGPKDDVEASDRESLQKFFLRHVHRLEESPIAEQRVALKDAEAHRVRVEAAIPGTLTFADLEKPRDAFVMIRGQYDKPGEKVDPSVPAVLPGLDVDGRPNRLDLARWLVSPTHPLTARVAVNRIWQQMFGTGLVRTSDDFGTRGELPSHPELLDWLAVEFRESGWDTKSLIRMLVSSATFRQRSVITPASFARDRANRLLSRGPRFRLDAEQLRDNALLVSGLINLKMGGRGVHPYQPPNIWEPVGYENSNTRYYMQDHGPALYRRSVYCFLKRTAPPPFMSNFDGPNREQVCTRRERSNTPLQALQLMNDVQHFEAARALAERAILEGGDSELERIRFLYQTVLARPPTGSEAALVRKAFAVQHQLFMADPKAARAAVHVGESQPVNAAPAPETAAWTMIANLILNLDETVTRN